MTAFAVQLACVASAIAASADSVYASLPLLVVVGTAASPAPALAVVAALLHVGVVGQYVSVDMVASMCGALAGIVLTPNKAVLGITVVWASITAAVLFAALAAEASLWWGAAPTAACAVVYAASHAFRRPKHVSVVGKPPQPVEEIEMQRVGGNLMY